MIENVTSLMNDALSNHGDIRTAMKTITGCSLFGRETRSAALGEISEHLVARIVNGQRRSQGNKGFDIIDAEGLMIEVKSRLAGRWGEDLMFDFRRHTIHANKAFCIVWDDKAEMTSILEAYVIPVSDLITLWGCQKQQKYCARTKIRKLRAAWKLTIK